MLENNSEFDEIIGEIIQNQTVQEMKKYRQHYDTSCFDHCKNVAYVGYKIAKKLKLDYKSTARAGMLHDLFLYDWRKKEDGRKGLHAFTHPKTAARKAQELFELSDKEQDIILKHMWPLTINLPKYPESYIITVADKYCAIHESCSHYKKTLFSKRVFKYVYLALGVFFIKYKKF